MSLFFKVLICQSMLFLFLNVTHLRADRYFGRFDARGASAIYPLNEQYFFMLGVGNMTAEVFPRVIQNMEDVLRLSPYHVDALNNLGVALAMLNRDKEARDKFSRVLELAPGHSHARENLKAIQRGAGNKRDFWVSVIWD